METISRLLLTFLVNSLWQIPLAAAAAALASRLLRKGPAAHRHTIWVAALAAAIVLPLVSVRRAQPADTLQFSPSLAAQSAGPISTGQADRIALIPTPTAPSRTISFAGTTAAILLGAYFLFVLFRLARLVRASLQTLRVRRRAQAADIPLTLDRVRSRCEQALGVDYVDLFFSSDLSGPVTAGRTIILPNALLSETCEDVLTTAIGHEMAHIARRDFACNFLYELLHLPIAFHPAAWLIRRDIERTREMACDEMVTRRLMDAGAYARSIMSIAAAMTALPRPGYSLGVFDGDILEERIRRLVERPAANLRRARLLLAGGLAALVLCAIIASSLSFTARAQGAAGDMLKQGRAALDRGDNRTAVGAFESAVRLQPDNLEAKLLLAKSLAQEYTSGADRSDSVVAVARQQYLDVLARNPANRQALHGMMSLLTNTKQFGEAYDWTQKAIRADVSDASAYYTAGFIDWATTYPDYMSARQAAGMQPPDPGIIPDAAIRHDVRARHLAQIEDGQRMLQLALQYEPGYSDAMAYMNLFYRIQAGIADTAAESAAMVAKADDWVRKALDARRQQANRTGEPLGPPPPPPPPPPTHAGVSGGIPGGVSGGIAQGVAGGVPGGVGGADLQRIRVEGSVQQAKLLKQAPPVYPPLARQAEITGTVTLTVTIGRDGAVRNIEVMRGHPLLVPAAINAVRQWVYQPTLLNGEPVEVIAPVNVTFAPQ